MSAALAKLKILVADDHPAMRRVIRRRCADLAGEIIECANAEEALDAFRRFQPDWVIMDLKMPGQDGVAATRAIRELSPTARVIIVSQFSGPELAEEAHRAGAVEFLNKEDLGALHRIILSHTPPSAS